MLRLAEVRLQSPRVRYEEADLFQWQPADVFDAVFFSFWLSHVPPERFTQFWSLVRRCLAPNARVFFVDSLHESTSTAIDHRLPESQATMLKRRLDDGREFQIYKVFYDVSELEDRLQRLGWQIHVSRTEKYFLYGYGGHNGA
jgi:demethylmenaquinone methyltransferase/2-methoxy-6-polyprenyl-1,4-benzoquinol methylase